MPLEIKEEGGRYLPIAVCDQCYDEISDARDGNYQWLIEEDGRPWDGRICFTHKRCCRAFEQTHPAGGGRWFAGPLECLPIYLENNLRLNRKEALALVRMLGRIW
jgi:hypothetical protein